jgi:hypothetical protein
LSAAQVDLCGSTLVTYAAPAHANLEDVVRPLGARMRGADEQDAAAARAELEALALAVASSLTYAIMLLHQHVSAQGGSQGVC